MTVHHETLRKRRGHQFYPTQAELRKLPALGSTDGPGDPMDLIVHLHYFGGPGDWYVLEYDPDTTIAFGWADLGFGEFGEFQLAEMEQVNVGLVIVERDLYWEPVPLRKALNR